MPRLKTVTFLLTEPPSATVPKSSEPGCTSISGRTRVVPPPQVQPTVKAMSRMLQRSRDIGTNEGTKGRRVEASRFCVITSGSRLLQAERLELVIERAPAHAEEPGRERAVALRLVEGILHGLTLGIFAAVIEQPA